MNKARGIDPVHVNFVRKKSQDNDKSLKLVKKIYSKIVFN